MAIDRAGDLAIGSVVGLDDDSVFCRRHCAAIGKSRERRGREAGDAGGYREATCGVRAPEAVRAGNPALSQTSIVPDATPAERPGMPAGRAVEHRAASAIGTAVPAGSTALRDAEGVGRHGSVERGYRHCLRCGRRHQAEADGENQNAWHFRGLFLPSLIAAVQQFPDLRKPTVC